MDDKHKMKIESFKADEGVQERVIQKLRGLKSNRDNEKVRGCLCALEQDARAGRQCSRTDRLRPRLCHHRRDVSGPGRRVGNL